MSGQTGWGNTVKAIVAGKMGWERGNKQEVNGCGGMGKKGICQSEWIRD